MGRHISWLLTVVVACLLAGCGPFAGKGQDPAGGVGINVVNADGTGLTHLTEERRIDLFPTWSPDGTRIAFMGDGGADIDVMNADGSGRTRLPTTPEHDLFPAWSPDGTRIAFAALPIEPAGGLAIYVVAADGSDLRRLEVAPPDEMGLGFGHTCDHRPAWSPDGAKLLFCLSGPNDAALFTIAPDGTGLERLTDPSITGGLAAWSPDGRQIAFASFVAGPAGSGLYVVNADGSGVVRLVEMFLDGNEPPVWCSDGVRLLFQGTEKGNPAAIYTINADGSNLTRLTDGSGLAIEPVWSPDCTRIAFVAADDADYDIHVMNADGSGRTELVATTLMDSSPAWSPDGTKVAFEITPVEEGGE